jgi:hypothetical protein
MHIMTKTQNAPNDELKSEDEARIVASDFAARKNLDERQAQEFAAQWFRMGEGFPERRSDALVRILKKQFGILD